MFRRLALTALSLLVLSATHLLAQSVGNPYYPIVKVPNEQGVIALVDNINGRTPLALERVLADNPGIREIRLHSGGGNVFSGLSIASRVHEMGLKTMIPSDAICFSACSFIFFAGSQRRAYGQLGVHQIAHTDGSGDLEGGQYAIADILDVLNRFDVHPNIFAAMFRTPPKDMYVFTPEENAKYGFFENSARSPGGQTNKFILEAVPGKKQQSWFVVAGSYKHNDISKARRREASLQQNGLAVNLINTDNYSNFTNGLYAVVVGPTNKSTAQRNLSIVKGKISDAYIKTGIK